MEGVSRARVCQLMRLLELAPEIQHDIDLVDSPAPIPTELVLRELSFVEDHAVQVGRYVELVAAEGAPDSGRPSRRAHRKGFQHLFAEGRRMAAMLDAGDASSYEDLGRQVGLSGDRVGQLVRLAGLDPTIVAVLDVPVKKLPPGVTKKLLRTLTTEADEAEQRRLLAAHLLGG